MSLLMLGLHLCVHKLLLVEGDPVLGAVGVVLVDPVKVLLDVVVPQDCDVHAALRPLDPRHYLVVPGCLGVARGHVPL